MGVWAAAEVWALAVGRARDSWQCRYKHVSESGVSDVGKLIELAAATLWDFGLTYLGLPRALIALACVFMALALLSCIFFRPLFLCFLAKYMFLRKLGFNPLWDSDLHIFLVVVSVPLSWPIVHGVVLGLGHVCTKAHGSWSTLYLKRMRDLICFKTFFSMKSFFFLKYLTLSANTVKLQ